MTTQNIISTPEITGNIGSCTTQTEQVIITSSLMYDNGYTIATNSCTGQVKEFDYHSINGFPMTMLGGIIILMFCILLSKLSD